MFVGDPFAQYWCIDFGLIENVDAIGIALPYSAIGGGRNVGSLRPRWMARLKFSVWLEILNPILNFSIFRPRVCRPQTGGSEK